MFFKQIKQNNVNKLSFKTNKQHTYTVDNINSASNGITTLEGIYSTDTFYPITQNESTEKLNSNGTYKRNRNLPTSESRRCSQRG